MSGLFLFHVKKNNVAITKDKKQEILAKLDNIKKDSDSIVFVSF